MGSYSMGPAIELVSALKDRFGLSCFVETGTYQGDTTLWAADHFESVYTIEAAEELHRAAQPRFADQSHIHSIYGSSDTELYKILPELPPSLFFLDAHWCGGPTAGENSECPLLSELALIMPWFRKHIVLIDDARLFVRPPPPPHKSIEWPSLDDIARVTHGQAYISIYQDVLILVSAWHRTAMVDLLRSLPYE